MVELSGAECPESVSQQAAMILKLFSDTGSCSSTSMVSCHCEHRALTLVMLGTQRLQRSRLKFIQIIIGSPL